MLVNYIKQKTGLSYLVILSTLLFSSVISILIIVGRIDSASFFIIEVTVQSSEKGISQIFYDIGNGFRESDSARINISKANIPVLYHFRVPRGEYRGLRFDPINKAAVVAFSDFKVLDQSLLNMTRQKIRIISAAEFQPTLQISSLTLLGDSVQIQTTTNANDPILQLSLDPPLILKEQGFHLLLEVGLFFLILVASLWILLILMETQFKRHINLVLDFCSRISLYANNFPERSIAGMAILAVVLSCYPVVFFGKSFVSPNHGTHLLYEKIPTLPGYDETTVESTMGSDVGAIMWAHLPYSIIQSRAIFQDYELPLWNRFNSTGVTLLGQGQSMFGDPLHIIVLLAKGASWAWDVKYIFAKILFSAGLGLTIYVATRHLSSTLLLTFSSAFIGFFSFRFNHPAIFSMCYSPWILFCWFGIIQAPEAKTNRYWICGLLLSNWAVMNSGTAKEAYMLLIGLNFCGVLLIFLSKGDFRQKAMKFLNVSVAGILFALLSSPVWLTFLDTLNKAYSSYNNPGAVQIQPNLLIGFFDDIFYRQLVVGEGHYNPSVNFFVLFGILWSLVSLKELLSNRVFISLSVSTLISFFLAFGILPETFITKVPFLRNVIHIGNTFSVVMIPQIFIMAGFGLKEYWVRFVYKEGKLDFLIAILILGFLLGLYFGTTQLVQKSLFFSIYVLLMLLSFVMLPFIIKNIRLQKSKLCVMTIFSMLLLFALLHIRHGMHLRTGIDKYVMNPQVRAVLQAKSSAIEYIKENNAQPFRTVGFGSNLVAGFNAALGIESIGGPDALINPYYRELTKLLPIDWGWDWRIISNEEKIDEFKPFYDFLNVGYYLSPQGNIRNEVSELKLLRRLDLNVYRSDAVWPRAFFTDRVAFYKQPSEFVNMVKNGDKRPFAAIQENTLNVDIPLRILSQDQNLRNITTATDYKLTNNTTSFFINAPSSGVVVLSEAYLDHDFRVTLNGKQTSYFRVNHAFKGLFLKSPGEYIVSFQYWPEHLTLSLWMSGVGIVMTLAWFFIERRYFNYKNKLILVSK